MLAQSSSLAKLSVLQWRTVAIRECWFFFEKYNAASPNPKLKNRQPESNYILLLWQGFEILYCIDIFIQKHLRSFHWACFEAHRKWPCEDNSFRKEKSVKIKVETRNDFEIVWKIHSFIWTDLKRNLCLPKYWLFVLSPPEFSSEEEHWLLSTQPILQTLPRNKRFWRTRKWKKSPLLITPAQFNDIPFLSIHH